MDAPLHLTFTRLALVFMLLGSSSGLAAKEDLEAKFNAGNAKLDAGEYGDAIEVYNQVLEMEPRASSAWVNRAIAKWNLKDLSGARADLSQAITIDKYNVAAYRARATLRFQSNDLKGSLSDLDAALQVGEADAELHGLRGAIFRAGGDQSRALDALGEAIRLNGDYVAARFLRGQILEDEHSPDAALADYDRVIALEPTHVDAVSRRGWIRFHRSDLEGAIADARRVIEFQPDYANGPRLLGYAQFGSGKYQEAATALSRTAELAGYDPDSVAFALILRHHALLRAGKPDKRLATSWGAWEDAWLQTLARFIVGQIDEDALEKLVEAATDPLEKAGRACEAHFYIGLARLQAGDKSTARLRFRSAVNTEATGYIELVLALAELKRL
jgi:tetratricopeptide (TPR) repeat protein